MTVFCAANEMLDLFKVELLAKYHYPLDSATHAPCKRIQFNKNNKTTQTAMTSGTHTNALLLVKTTSIYLQFLNTPHFGQGSLNFYV